MRKFTRRATTVVAAGMLTAMISTSAIAAETTQTVNPGSLTSSLANLGLTAVEYSHDDQPSTGTLALNVDDTSGTGDGWNVTVQSSEFAYSGTNGGTAIPAANFALTGAATPVQVGGQAVDEPAGPRAVTTTGTLDTALVVIEADAENGQGEYTQDLDVELTIPGQSRAGTYTGTVTTTATAGPTT